MRCAQAAYPAVQASGTSAERRLAASIPTSWMILWRWTTLDRMVGTPPLPIALGPAGALLPCLGRSLGSPTDSAHLCFNCTVLPLWISCLHRIAMRPGAGKMPHSHAQAALWHLCQVVSMLFHPLYTHVSVHKYVRRRPSCC